jgi:4-amino-4-deoxy-L-arabinose transferase-like glycosyltransferase
MFNYAKLMQKNNIQQRSLPFMNTRQSCGRAKFGTSALGSHALRDQSHLVFVKPPAGWLSGTKSRSWQPHALRAIPHMTTHPMPVRHALSFSALMIVLWVLCAAWFNSAQFGDNIEQFNWAQGLEFAWQLGYHKHPPLPTWLLGGVIKLFGPSIYWAYLCAGLCLLGTAGFTWLISRELLGDERVAAVAVVLWGLNLTFSQRAQLYNHNTVLVLCMTSAVWCGLCATRHSSQSSRLRMLWWVATGLSTGAALLSKYQAAVPLAGLLVALVWADRLKASRLKHSPPWAGLVVALGVMLLVVTPHAVWVIQHDFSTLRYASEAAVDSANLGQRLGFVASFWANQIRLWFPALLTMAMCWAISLRSVRLRAGAQAPSAPVERISTPALRLWMWGLIWGGVLVLMGMALLAGVSLRNHWGVQALQFFSLWLAWWWDTWHVRHVHHLQRPERCIRLRHLVWVALLVHGVSLIGYALAQQDSTKLLASRRIDTLYPAQRLAQTAAAHWAAHTRCPLRYVAGSVFEAGLISLYADTHSRPYVFDSERATPWLNRSDLQRSGALYVLTHSELPPKNLTHFIQFELVPGSLENNLQIGLHLPQQPCL